MAFVLINLVFPPIGLLGLLFSTHRFWCKDLADYLVGQEIFGQPSNEPICFEYAPMVWLGGGMALHLLIHSARMSSFFCVIVPVIRIRVWVPPEGAPEFGFSSRCTLGGVRISKPKQLAP